MPNKYNKPRAGDSSLPSASMHGHLVDTLKTVEAMRNKVGAGKAKQQFQQPDIIWIKNNSGDTRNRFDVLKLDTPVITQEDNEGEFLNKIILNAVAADGNDNNLVILQKPLNDGQIDFCGLVLGATVARIEILDADHQFAVYSADHPEYLESAASGSIKLFYNPGVDADAFGIILLGGGGSPSSEATTIRGTTTNYVSHNDETFSISNITLLNPVGCDRLVGQTSGGSGSSTGTVTVHNVIEWDIDANSLIYATWNDTDQQYEVIVANCPAGDGSQ